MHSGFIETGGNLSFSEWQALEKNDKLIMVPGHIQYVHERDGEEILDYDEKVWYQIDLSNGKLVNIKRSKQEKKTGTAAHNGVVQLPTNSVTNEVERYMQDYTELVSWLPKLIEQDFQIPIITRDNHDGIVFVDIGDYHTYWSNGFGNHRKEGYGFIKVETARDISAQISDVSKLERIVSGNHFKGETVFYFNYNDKHIGFKLWEGKIKKAWSKDLGSNDSYSTLLFMGSRLKKAVGTEIKKLVDVYKRAENIARMALET